MSKAPKCHQNVAFLQKHKLAFSLAVVMHSHVTGMELFCGEMLAFYLWQMYLGFKNHIVALINGGFPATQIL